MSLPVATLAIWLLLGLAGVAWFLWQEVHHPYAQALRLFDVLMLLLGSLCGPFMIFIVWRGGEIDFPNPVIWRPRR